MDRLTQIRNYFDGKLSKAEAEEFLKWYLSEKSDEDVHAEFDKMWHGKAKPEFEYDGKQLFQQILKDKDNTRFLNVLREPANVRSFSTSWWKVAAAVALLIVSVMVILQLRTTEVHPQQVEIIKDNPAGQKSKVYLPDGTIVTLNSESRITYFENFEEGRNVTLEGEAFFDVTEDPSRPFTVYSGSLATTALGTSFNIRSYNTSQAEVALVTGKVKVRRDNSDDLVYLVPGETASISNEMKSILKGTADVQAITYWKDGVLYFDKTEVDDVVQILERWYGVEIEVIGGLPDVKCSGTFQKNEYLTNVLDILSYSVGFEYSLAGKQVQIKFNQK
tara:strand:+ start:222 stop:1220 length:999 start_codon:yes stop_codon:yes gene_type:complete